MIEQYLSYITHDIGRILLVSLSILLAVLAWLKLYYAEDSLMLRMLAAPLPLFPIFGSLAVFWIFNMPPRQPRHLRQNRWNHYGTTEFGKDDDHFGVADDMSRATRRKKARSKNKTRQRQGIDIMSIIVIGFFAINFMMYALIALRDGSGSYTNWWGGQVYGPVAIIIAVLLIAWIIKRNAK